VINEDSEHYIKSPAEFTPILGSIEALARLSQAGWRIAVVTNQSGLARGLFTLSTLHAIHQSCTSWFNPQGGGWTQSSCAHMALTRDALVESLPQHSFNKPCSDSMYQPMMRSQWATLCATFRAPRLPVFLPFWFAPVTAD
jgi:histidinol phosphatase-like enzyme